MTDKKNARFRLPPGSLVFGGFWLLLVRHLSVHWAVNPQYSFGWLVPFLLAYLLWRRWSTRPDAGPAEPLIAGLAAAAAALAFFPTWLVEQPNPDWRLASWALALEIVAMTLAAAYFAGGRPWLRHFAFPICFILTAVPWPFGPEQALIQHLAQFVAAATVELLNLFSIPATRSGNVIQIAAGLLGVDDACSGVRSLQATFMASLFLGELYRFPAGRRVLLVGVGIVLALLCNIGRAFLLAWVASRRGIEAVATVHDQAGFTILTLCFIGAWVVSLLLMRGHREPQNTSPKILARRLPVPLIGGLAFSLVFSVAATETWYRAHEHGEKIRWTFNWPGEDAQVRDIKIPEVAVKALQYNEGRGGEWREGHTHWAAYFFKWAAGPARSRILARTHRPEICLPASGCKLQTDRGTIMGEGSGVTLPFHAYTFNASGNEVYVYFCLWEDSASGSRQAENTTGWDRLAGLQSVRRGERNLGQQVLEIVIYGCANADEADAELRRKLPKLVTRM